MLLAQSEEIWFTKYKLVHMNQNRDQLCMVKRGIILHTRGRERESRSSKSEESGS